MKRAYSQLAWGLVLELIDFRIQYFDIFPDFVGFLLIMAGLSRLRPKNRPFLIGWGAAGILLFFSAPRLVGQGLLISLTDPQTPEPLTMLIMAVEAAVELTMLYGICAGIRLNALKFRWMNLAETARKTWLFLFAFFAGWLFGWPFSLNRQPEDFTVFALAAGTGLFIASLCVIFLVRKAGRHDSSQGGKPIGGMDP